MKPTLLISLALIATFSGRALAQTPETPLKTIAAGAKVTLGSPTDGDDVLKRLVGVQCVAATKLTRNADGSYNGSVTCGAVTLKSKRFALGDGGPVALILGGNSVPATDAKIASGAVIITGIGAGDLFAARSAELVGKLCSITKTLTRDAQDFYAGELMCGKDRFYFAEVQVSVAVASKLVIGVTGIEGSGRPYAGERWRISNVGETYTTINSTDCLRWPTPEIRRIGGESGWEASIRRTATSASS